MYVTDLLSLKSIQLQAPLTEKSDIIRQLVNLLDCNHNLLDKEAFLSDVLAREALGSTGIAEGIAIPHARSKAVEHACLSALTTASPVDFNSRDGEPSQLFFMIATPLSENNLHIEILGKLSLILLNKELRNTLAQCTDPEIFIKTLARAEALSFVKL